MVPHGPDAATYVRAVADPCDAPVLLNRGLAFMFETYLPLRVNPQALRDEAWRDVDYTACWQDLTAAHFTGWDWVNGTVETTREEDDR
jgi:homogentisate 1,2-dioxygenase